MADIELQPVQSSNIAAIGYDEQSRTLAVRFHNGSEYHYRGVPARVAERFRSAPSIGKFFAQEIRGKFEGSPR